MNPSQMIKAVQLAIANADYKEVFRLLNTYATETNNLDLGNQVALLEGRNTQNNFDFSKGLMTNEENEVEQNQIGADILSLLKAIHTGSQLNPQTPGQAPKKGVLLHNVPQKMTLQKETRCLVRIAYSELLARQDIPDSVIVEVTDVRLAEVMAVELVDPSGVPSFAIRTINDEEQLVISDDYTQWNFYVKPLREGQHPLMIKVSVVEIVKGIERRRDIVLEKEVLIVSENVTEQAGKLVSEAIVLANSPTAAVTAAEATAGAEPGSAMPQKSGASPTAGWSMQKIMIGLGSLAAVMIGVFMALPLFNSSNQDNPTMAVVEDTTTLKLHDDVVWADTASPQPQNDDGFANNGIPEDDEAAMSPLPTPIPKIEAGHTAPKPKPNKPAKPVKQTGGEVAPKPDPVVVKQQPFENSDVVVKHPPLPPPPPRVVKGNHEIIFLTGKRAGKYELYVDGKLLVPFESAPLRRHYSVPAGKIHFDIITNDTKCSVDTVTTDQMFVKSCDL
jgi:Effector-associated domain 11